MNKIIAFALKQFQAHENSLFEFSEGVNVIAGSSHNGKSSVIRGLRWIITNRPTGTNFRKWFIEDSTITKATLLIGDNQVTRARNLEKVNKYVVNKEVYTALSGNVPIEVQNILNVSDVNLQTQFEPFFLLQQSSGDVAKRLNALVGLAVIDESQKKLASIIKETNTDIAYITKDLVAEKQRLDSFKYLGKIARKLTEADKLYKEFVENDAVWEELEGIVAHLEAVDLSKFDHIDSIADAISTANSMVGEYTINEDSINSLSRVVRNLSKVETRIEQLNECTVDTTEVQALIAQYVDSLKRSESLKSSVQVLSGIEGGLLALEVAQIEYEHKLEDLKREAGVCPLCGGNFK